METDTEGFVTEPAPTPAYRLPYDAAALDAAHADAEEPKPVLPWWFGELDEVKR